MAEHDLVVRGGTVVDGTGRRRLTADVAMDGATITRVGRVDGRGRREIQADGLIVTPGWVDIHTHYDGQVLWDPLLECSSAQGVTTVVLGNCGVGFAPTAPEHRSWLIGLMEGVEDIPAAVLHEAIDWRWGSFEEYLAVLDRLPLAIDIAAQIPHAALRVYAMGERGQDHTSVPTPYEIEAMAAEAARAITAGAVGFTTSRSPLHKASDGRLTPTFGASPAELLGIVRAIGATGRGVLEFAAELSDLEAEFALIRSLSEASGRPGSLSTVQSHGRDPDRFRQLLRLIEDANAAGASIRGQVCARPPGVVMTLEGSVQPLLASETYRSLLSLPLDERVAALRQAELRARVLAELAQQDADSALLHGVYPYAFAMDDPARYAFDPDESIAAVSARSGRTREEVALDVLLDRDGRGVIWAPGANFIEPDLRATREMLVHPLTLPGIGDGGAHCTIVCDTSFPTFMVTHWARDADEDDRLDLEWVVRRQAADTAAWMGLHDRGILAPGRKGDLNIIDLDALELGIPEIAADFPLGGKRLVQRARGYRATVVAGEVVLEDGVHTGALPGALARGH
jgi:N-acyl-D-aspartate/D-glutamate deacylase